MPGKLMDTFGRSHRYLRISLTDQCNFRCRYCMPVEGMEWESAQNLLSDDEVLRMASVFVQLGFEKIRLTGGEPTLRKNLVPIVEKLVKLEGIKRVAMTTNGSTLERKAQTYRDAGISVLNVSLDSLRQDRFEQITRRNQLDLVLRGIERAIKVGFDELKINVVVMNGLNDSEILDFVEFARHRMVTVRFIEFMPFVGNRWSEASLYPYLQMREDISSQYELLPLQTEKSAVGKDFFIPGFAGKIGFVTSMTESFCGDCDRVRLTADGSIKPCLFSDLEVNVRSALRQGASDDELAGLIHEAIRLKPKEHQPMVQLSKIQTRSMIRIGG